MHLLRLAGLSVGFIILVHGSHVAAADVNDFIDFSTDDLPGRLYIPPEAQESATPRPLILFLHGAGETGTNNRSQINSNIDNLFNVAKQRGAFLYAPQATTVVGGIFNWSDVTRTANVMTMVDNLLAEQNADPNRVYVTGLSMGGGGAWNMASRFADRFAATVPIAGVTTADDFEAVNLVNKPTWAFHARNDGVVSKNYSRTVVNQILEAAGEPTIDSFPANNDLETTLEYTNESVPLNYTEWPTGGHGIWGRVYNTTALYDWLFDQQTVGNSTPMGIPGIPLSGLGETYIQDFDEALGNDGSLVGITLPAGWTNGGWSTATSAPFPVEKSFTGQPTFNAGATDDSDRALAIGVASENDKRFLQLRASVTDAAATSFQLQFDVEAWDARDGTYVAPLDRFVGLPDDPGEAAFQVTLDINTGDGFVPLADLGTVTTGPTLEPVFEGIVNGNAEPNRVSFDSGVVAAAIPAGSDLRVRWSTIDETNTLGWVFGLDNVVLSVMSGIVEGDINGDGAVDVADLDALTAAVTAGTDDLRFDVNGSGNVDDDDRTYWVTDIKQTIFGDVNFDRVIDSTDLNAIGLNWQSTTATSWSQGDFNGDGKVNAADLNDVGRNWQRSIAAHASQAAVPEPSGVLLFALGLAWFGIRRSVGSLRRKK